MISYTFPRDPQPYLYICIWYKGSCHADWGVFFSPEAPQKWIIKSVCCMSLLVPHCHENRLFTTNVMWPYRVACVGKQSMTQLALKPYITLLHTESNHFSFNEIWRSAMQLVLMGTAWKAASLIDQVVFCAVGSKCWAKMCYAFLLWSTVALKLIIWSIEMFLCRCLQTHLNYSHNRCSLYRTYNLFYSQSKW